MEGYRKKLKMQNIFYGVGMVVAILLMVLSAKGVIQPISGDHRWTGLWSGFLSGITGAFAMLALLGLATNLRAMKNPEKLRAQYIKTHDERTAQIWAKSGANAYWFDVTGLLLAAVVAGYFSTVVFLALYGALLYICVVRLILKVYYGKKF